MSSCIVCNAKIGKRRSDAGYRLCLTCGDRAAKKRKWTVAHLNKSSFFVVTDKNQLKQLNPKKIGE